MTSPLQSLLEDTNSSCPGGRNSVRTRATRTARRSPVMAPSFRRVHVSPPLFSEFNECKMNVQDSIGKERPSPRRNAMGTKVERIGDQRETRPSNFRNRTELNRSDPLRTNRCLSWTDYCNPVSRSTSAPRTYTMWARHACSRTSGQRP
jgi:hypothetical protein